ncbi:MAG: acylphosphatase [Acidobacteria bacterium]|nr:acylphosphatase [Acidobacteriota bacterium]
MGARLVARRYLVQGMVQGVGFRYFTEHAARRSRLHGFVRNLDDGRVEVVVEGDAAAVARFEQAIRNGPPLARVDRIEIESRDPAGRFSRFEIRA